ncbi:MAG: RDD family protein [Planctomycetota bacterium]
MSGQIRFETPENIEVAYEVAGLGTRFTAWMLDQFLIFIVVVFAFFALLISGAAGDALVEQLESTFEDTAPGQPPQFTTYLIGFFYLLFSLGSFIYFGFSELLMRGQTIGKRKLGIRVVQVDGFALRPASILVRTIFRVADHLPLLWIVPLVAGEHRRVGDWVAGTTVVVDDPDEMTSQREEISKERIAESEFKFPQVALSKARPQDLETVERLLKRLQGMGDHESGPLLETISSSLAKRLGVEAPEESKQAQFLKDFLAAHYYQEYRRLG